jgi:competence protein ComFC
MKTALQHGTSIAGIVRSGANALASLLYPPRCEYCAAGVPQDEYLCASCRAKAKRIKPPFCERCSEPFDGEITQEFECANCAHRQFHFTHAVSCFLSRSIVREMVHRFKYGRQFHLRFPLADWLLETMNDPRIAAQPVEFFVPVPLHSTRQRFREFNQAEALAKLISAKANVPMLNCLCRIRNTTTQTHFDRAERMENLRNAFQMRQSSNVRGKHLVLVDDVFTTGSTVDECARVLMRAGAASVRAITVARG